MRYFISFLLIVGLVVLAFVLVFTSLESHTTKTTTQPLVNYSNTDTQVEVTIDGPINADQLHSELQMTVGASLSQMDLDQGYQGTVVQSKSYANNPSSYAEFLRALDFAGFSLGDTSSKADNNPIGYCASGDRYTFRIVNPNGNNIENFWSTSCGGAGTFKGKTATVLDLFSAQMPDYSEVSSAGSF